MKFMMSVNRLRQLICKFLEGIHVYEGSIPFAAPSAYAQSYIDSALLKERLLKHVPPLPLKVMQ
jgi:hypothetical protein